MPATQVSQYLTFANLQMAAEAIDLPRVLTGVTTLSDALSLGNNRSSKFTLVQAAQFVQEWRVLDHRSNTSTSFSGTLFEYIGNNTDPALGPVNGQRVISLRSTEFVDDANDALFGGRGSDLLIAGAGDDDPNGDDDYAPSGIVPWSIGAMAGNEFDRLSSVALGGERAMQVRRSGATSALRARA